MGIPDNVQALLRTHRVGHLATVDAGGSPHIVPICFVCDGQTIYSAIDHKPKRLTGYRLKRVRNIQENPRVAFLIHHYDEDWQQLYYVQLRGTAVILERGAERQRALALLERKYAQYRNRQLADSNGLVIKVLATTVRHWGW